MAGLLSKISSFARTPAGQRALRTATTRVQALARDPRAREKLSQVGQRVRGRSGSTSPEASAPVREGGAPEDGPRRDDGGPAHP